MSLVFSLIHPNNSNVIIFKSGNAPTYLGLDIDIHNGNFDVNGLIFMDMVNPVPDISTCKWYIYVQCTYI